MKRLDGEGMSWTCEGVGIGFGPAFACPGASFAPGLHFFVAAQRFEPCFTCFVRAAAVPPPYRFVASWRELEELRITVRASAAIVPVRTKTRRVSFRSKRPRGILLDRFHPLRL